MDVHCSTCGEPWDTYHLWHDAIWDTGLPEAEIRKWEKLPQNEKLAPKWREAFQAAGYVFGRTVINIVRCPACRKDAQPDTAKLQIKAAHRSRARRRRRRSCGATFEDHGL